MNLIIIIIKYEVHVIIICLIFMAIYIYKPIYIIVNYIFNYVNIIDFMIKCIDIILAILFIFTFIFTDVSLKVESCVDVIFIKCISINIKKSIGNVNNFLANIIVRTVIQMFKLID